MKVDNKVGMLLLAMGLAIVLFVEVASADEPVNNCEPTTKTIYVEKVVYVDRLVQETNVIEQPSLPLKKNRLKLLVGVAPQRDLNVSQFGTQVNVSNEQGLTGGLSYDRLLNKRLSLGIQGQTNGTVLGSFGIDF